MSEQRIVNSEQGKQKATRLNYSLLTIHYFRPRERSSRGFSIVEMIVAVALFVIVMVVAMGALMALVDANRKARALESVMSNLNIALDGMVRSLRMGSRYDCEISEQSGYTTPTDCRSGDGGRILGFLPYGGDPLDGTEYWVYAFVPGSEGVSGYIARSTDNGQTFLKITAPEVDITSMKFYVDGTNSGDTVQPKIVMLVEGTAGAAKVKTRTTFSIQATAVQRILDI